MPKVLSPSSPQFNIITFLHRLVFSDRQRTLLKTDWSLVKSSGDFRTVFDRRFHRCRLVGHAPQEQKPTLRLVKNVKREIDRKINESKIRHGSTPFT